MILSASAQKTAQVLLDWDLLRVAALSKQGHDVTVYQERQRAAQHALMAGLPVENWPRTSRDVLQALLEVSMTRQHATQFGFGLAKTPPKVAPNELKGLAIDLGVIDHLREVAPKHWRAE